MSQKNHKTTLLLADDHNMFLEGLFALLNDEDDLLILGSLSNGKEVLTFIEYNELPDILITDISMPEIDGIKLNKIIKTKYPSIKVIVLSMFNQSELLSKLIKNDVDGYLLKNTDINELLQAINNVKKGEKYFSEGIKEEFMKSMFAPKKVKKSQTKLSKREIEILVLIANEFTTQQIAEKLFLSQYTVETHRKNILRKINAKNTAGLVKYAIQQGLI